MQLFEDNKETKQNAFHFLMMPYFSSVIIQANGLLKTVSSMLYVPLESSKPVQEEENNEELDLIRRKAPVCHRLNDEKTVATRISTRKRILRTFDDGIAPKRPKYNLGR